MLLDADESQLLLIDYQEKLMPVIHGGAEVVANAVRLGRIAQLLQVPVVGTEQNPQRLGANLPEIKALCSRTLAKMHFSAVPDGLLPLLRPPAPAQRGGNARSLPRHLQRPAPGGQAAQGQRQDEEQAGFHRGALHEAARKGAEGWHDGRGPILGARKFVGAFVLPI